MNFRAILRLLKGKPRASPPNYEKVLERTRELEGYAKALKRILERSSGPTGCSSRWRGFLRKRGKKVEVAGSLVSALKGATN